MNVADQSWVGRLRTTGAVRDRALRELRELLLLRLRQTFRGRSGVDEALLEDITQESLLRTLGHLEQFRGKSRFTTWATAIAVRVAFTELRRRHWKDVSLDQMLAETPRTEDCVLAEVDGDQVRRGLVETMYHLIESELTAKQRVALLAELQGMPLEEIGRRMGSNRNAVYKLTHDGRQRLKRGLEAAGYSVADLQTG